MSSFKLQNNLINQAKIFTRSILGVFLFCVTSQMVSAVTSYTPQQSDPTPQWLEEIQEHITTNDLSRTNINIQAMLPLLILRSAKGDAWSEGLLGTLMMEGREVPMDTREGIRLLRDSAERGCGKAMDELGGRYISGRGVKPDYQEALHWLHLAADRGFPNAQADIGYCYSMGFGVATNYVEAMKWFRMAAAQTNAFAMMHIGILYFYGYGVQRDYVTAEKWMLPAAKLGNARAMFFMGQLTEKDAANANSAVEAFGWYKKSAELGDRFGCLNLFMCFFNGTGTPKDPTNSIYWARKAAVQGIGDAQYFLGDIYLYGKYAPKAEETAQEWYRSAVTNGNPSACFMVAMSLGYPNLKSNINSFAESQRLMLQAAQAGHRSAQLNAAMGYFFGYGGVTNYDAGQHWLLESAKGGWPMSEYSLGLAYLNGQFQFSVDKVEGVKWLRQAANDDCLLAQGVLGIKLVTGTDMPRDAQEGVKWFRRAAEFGDAKGENDLGYSLETGLMGAPDMIEVCKWYQLAVNQGLSPSRVNLARVLPKLNDSQLEEAARRVEQFKPLPLPELNPMRPLK